MGCPGRGGGDTDCEVRVEKVQKQLREWAINMRKNEKECDMREINRIKIKGNRCMSMNEFDKRTALNYVCGDNK